jgi:hypothetical protein
MRVSGTLIDRLFVRLLPIAILLGTILYVTTSTEILSFIKKWTTIVIIIWLFDSIALMSKSVKGLFIIGDKLRIGKDVIDVEDLLSINKKRDERRGTTIRTIELEYLKSDMLTKAQIISKPTFGDFLGRKAKTIDILTSKFPSLTNRVFGEV